MLFQACAGGVYTPGQTYCERDAVRVFANGLRCITNLVAPSNPLLEVRIEGARSFCYDKDAVIGKKMTVVRELTPEERCSAWTGLLVKKDGTQMWFLAGKLHREGDLPAVIGPNGDQMWFLNGQRHRERDLPAIVRSDGRRQWWRNGQLHREGGPAEVIFTIGYQAWYYNGKLHREDGPAELYADGTQKWFLNGVKIKMKRNAEC